MKAANDLFLTVCNLSHPILPTIHDQQLLTLRWRTFLRWGREGIAICFAFKGSQWFLYDCLQPVAPHITQDTRPTIVDAPLTLIYKMGQGAFLFLFCLQKQPLIGLWLFATGHTPYYPKYTTNNRWRSVDAYFQHRAGNVSLSLLPIKAANHVFMTFCNLSDRILPKIHDQQSLTLRWDLFSSWGREGIATCIAYKGGQRFL